MRGMVRCLMPPTRKGRLALLRLADFAEPSSPGPGPRQRSGVSGPPVRSARVRAEGRRGPQGKFAPGGRAGPPLALWAARRHAPREGPPKEPRPAACRGPFRPARQTGQALAGSATIVPAFEHKGVAGRRRSGHDHVPGVFLSGTSPCIEPPTILSASTDGISASRPIVGAGPRAARVRLNLPPRFPQSGSPGRSWFPLRLPELPPGSRDTSRGSRSVGGGVRPDLAFAPTPTCRGQIAKPRPRPARSCRRRLPPCRRGKAGPGAHQAGTG